MHSLKDSPAEVPAGLTLAAFPEREDPRDALVTRERRRFEDLRTGARLGTGSPRRCALVLALRPDLVVEPVRGNVGTRLRKLETEDWDGMLLAAAGLKRRGLNPEHVQPLAPEVFVPAVGQGILAVEARVDDRDILALLERLDHVETRAAALAERAYLRRLGASCNSPVAAHAAPARARLRMDALVASQDGRKVLRASAERSVRGARAAGLAARRNAARSRGRRGGGAQAGAAMARIIRERIDRPLEGRTIVVTRARVQAHRFVQLLEAAGARVLQAPTIVIEPPASWVPPGHGAGGARDVHLGRLHERERGRDGGSAAGRARARGGR